MILRDPCTVQMPLPRAVARTVVRISSWPPFEIVDDDLS